MNEAGAMGADTPPSDSQLPIVSWTEYFKTDNLPTGRRRSNQGLAKLDDAR